MLLRYASTLYDHFKTRFQLTNPVSRVQTVIKDLRKEAAASKRVSNVQASAD